MSKNGKMLGDRYLIDMDRMLGKGMYSEVFKGKDLKTKEPIAVKTISKERLSTLDQFTKTQEFKVHQTLDHPAIAKVYEIRESQTKSYLFSEYCDFSLKELMDKNQIQESDVKRYLNQIIMAMMYLSVHQIKVEDTIYEGICHLDIKPQNILIKNNNIKITDFGLCRSYLSKEPHSGNGTPEYMTLEQLQLKVSQNLEKDDIWAMGVILYEIVYGRHPLIENEKGFPQILKCHEQKEIQYPQQNYYSEKLIKVIQAMLQKNPEQRVSWSELLLMPFCQNDFFIIK